MANNSVAKHYGAEGRGIGGVKKPRGASSKKEKLAVGKKPKSGKTETLRVLTPAEARARRRATAKRNAMSAPRVKGEPPNRIKSIRGSGTSAKRPRKTARLEYRGTKKK